MQPVDDTVITDWLFAALPTGPALERIRHPIAIEGNSQCAWGDHRHTQVCHALNDLYRKREEPSWHKAKVLILNCLGLMEGQSEEITAEAMAMQSSFD